jgi:Bacterial EndoU nuclease
VHNACRNPLSNFSNVNNLKPNFVDHMEGEVSGNVAKGFHSMLSTVGRKVGNNYSELVLPNGDKVYKAIVEVKDSNGNWIRKARPDGTPIPSSFFPDNWGYQKIIDEVNLVFERGVFVEGSVNSFRYRNPTTGLTIEIYRQNLGTPSSPIWGKVISSFPII